MNFASEVSRPKRWACSRVPDVALVFELLAAECMVVAQVF
jgi:hypothetical protein